MSPRRVPEVRSVARVESILVYAPAIDPVGLFPHLSCFLRPRPKISKSFPRRYSGAQGRERPGGVRGWPLRRGAANATRRDCTSHIPAKRVAFGCPCACGAPGSAGTSPFLCLRLVCSMKRPQRESPPRTRQRGGDSSAGSAGRLERAPAWRGLTSATFKSNSLSSGSSGRLPEPIMPGTGSILSS